MYIQQYVLKRSLVPYRQVTSRGEDACDPVLATICSVWCVVRGQHLLEDSIGLTKAQTRKPSLEVAPIVLAQLELDKQPRSVLCTFVAALWRFSMCKLPLNVRPLASIPKDLGAIAPKIGVWGRKSLSGDKGQNSSGSGAESLQKLWKTSHNSV